MTEKSLTKAERDWLARLQSILDECPSDRLNAFTTGDRTVTIYNAGLEDQINEMTAGTRVDFCQAVDKLNAKFYTIDFPFTVHSTSG